ncbi:MAG: hypothetical protein WKF47_05650 [Geodermatophilaceae bacterium]
MSARLLTSNIIPGGASSVLARTELVRRVGGFDQRLSNMADYDLWIRLALASPLAGVDRPLVGYFVHSTGMASQRAALDGGVDHHRGQVPDDSAGTRHRHES